MSLKLNKKLTFNKKYIYVFKIGIFHIHIYIGEQFLNRDHNGSKDSVISSRNYNLKPYNLFKRTLFILEIIMLT